MRMEVNNEDLNVRLPTEEEMILFNAGDYDSSADSGDDDSDSNNENYYTNDYPDEDEFKGFDNDSTTTEDDYGNFFNEKNFILFFIH